MPPLAFLDWSNLSTGTLISLIVSLIFVGLYLPSLINRLQNQMGQTLRHMLIWFGIIAAILIGYAFKTELGQVKDRVFGVLMPGSAVEMANGEVVVSKNSDEDHFKLQVQVNGQESEFMVDTGASDVVLSYESAKQLGFDLSESDFNKTVATANGLTKVANIKISQMRLASIIVKNVTASVSRPGELDVNLLGMSFLSRLKSYTVEGDRLSLRQ